MKNLIFQPGRDFARRMDEGDELAHFREAFAATEPGLIYLDGNSLGRLPVKTVLRLKQVVEEEWGRGLVRSWNRGWYDAPSRAGEKVAALVGAGPGQVVVCDSTSVNLFKLAAAALAMRPDRKGIVTDALNFPSDLYILEGVVKLLGEGRRLHRVPSKDGIRVETDDLADALEGDTALLALSHVSYQSGFLHDMEAVTKAAHERGVLVCWDLSHSAGVVPVELDRFGADLAVGCTYKYLNGGPGAPAFLYVRRALQEEARSPLWGWFGQRAPFAFEAEYAPAGGIGRFLAGTPPVLSLLALEPALDLVREAGLERIRRKSVHLTSYLVYLADTVLAPLGFVLGSPRDAARRGSHVSLRHAEGYRINRALIEEMLILPDFRAPDLLRLGLSPLYTTFTEVWEAVDRTRRVVEEERYRNYPEERLPVT